MRYLFIGQYRDMREWAREHKIPEKFMIHGSKGSYGLHGINCYVEIVNQARRSITSQEADAIQMAQRLQALYRHEKP